MRTIPLIVLFLSMGVMTLPATRGWAQQGGEMEGSGFGVYDTESIKGFDENKVNADPVCDRNKRPKILKVEPDEAKPGDRIVIKGENFGTKECMHGVTFSAAPGMKVTYSFVNDSTIEATVPEAKAGMTFVVVVAGGGSAQSKAVLIKTK
jgi:hypothetical protein